MRLVIAVAAAGTCGWLLRRRQEAQRQARRRTWVLDDPYAALDGR